MVKWFSHFLTSILHSSRTSSTGAATQRNLNEFLFLAYSHIGWEDVEEEDGNEEEEEEEEEVVQEVTKPVRDIRKRADATRILTTEDFQLIGTSHFSLHLT